jgi:YggT family protein
MDSAFSPLLDTLSSTLTLYFYVLIVRVLLTWFPTIDWYSQPFAFLSQVTDPYLNLFRSLLPPIGGIDFSPMVAILLLQAVAGILT